LPLRHHCDGNRRHCPPMLSRRRLLLTGNGNLGGRGECSYDQTHLTARRLSGMRRRRNGFSRSRTTTSSAPKDRAWPRYWRKPAAAATVTVFPMLFGESGTYEALYKKYRLDAGYRKCCQRCIEKMHHLNNPLSLSPRPSEPKPKDFVGSHHQRWESMRASVDPTLCTACGLCVDECPEVFQMGAGVCGSPGRHGTPTSRIAFSTLKRAALSRHDTRMTSRRN